MAKHLIAPSLLAADFLHLSDQIEIINQSEADWLHIDVMDGRFVPNISFGQILMPFIQKACKKPLDVHLMIEEPEKYVEDFVNHGAANISVHYEACRHLHSVLQKIRSYGVKAGIAINPHTDVSLLDDVLEETDLVCVMSVNPGFGGQKFIYRSLHKIESLKTRIIERNLPVLIEVDGGVGLQNAESILNAGTDVLVAGSSVFKATEPTKAITKLKALGH